jgi:Flp pilus assembly protein TadG
MFGFTFFKKFRDDNRGTVAIIFGLACVALIGFVGLSIDVGSWVKKRSDLASSADFGSLAGTRALVEALLRKDDANAETIARTTALKYIAENGGADATPDLTVSINRPYGVRVTLNEAGQQYFSKAVGQSAPTVGVVSHAVANRVADACVVALDPDAEPGIRFGLSGEVVANGCAIWSNSEPANSMDGQGSGSVSSDTNCAVGGAAATSGLNISPKVRPNCLKVRDPFAEWTAPNYDSRECDFNNVRVNGQVGTDLLPGKYCGGITILGGASVNFLPGEFIIDGGNLVGIGSSSLTGDRVCFLFTNGAGIDLSGTASVDLTPCTTSESLDLAGMIFASGRDEPRVTSTIAGNNRFILEGHVYLPTHDVNFSGGPDGGFPPDYTTLAAATIRFDGTARTTFRNASSPSDYYSARAFSHIYLTE